MTNSLIFLELFVSETVPRVSYIIIMFTTVYTVHLLTIFTHFQTISDSIPLVLLIKWKLNLYNKTNQSRYVFFITFIFLSYSQYEQIFVLF